MRFTLKKKLLILVSERSYSPEQLAALIRFIDLLMRLPEDLEREIHHLIREKFLPMKSQIKFKEYMHFSNILHEAVYGETYDEWKKKNTHKVAREFLRNGVAPEVVAASLKLPLETVLSLISSKGDA